MGSPVKRSVAEHQRAVLAALEPLPARDVPIGSAGGAVLATDVHSRTPIPLFDNSAMDGYAVRRADLIGAGPDHPVTLPVIADLPAGTSARPQVGPGTVARIMTGAPMPPGADAVVPVEDTDAGTTTVTISAEPAEAAHIRRAGDDLAPGDLVLRAGTRLTARHLAAAAGAGHGTLAVHPKPRVAVISTGTELVDPGTAPAWGQIPDSNSYLLAQSVTEAGGTPVRIGAVPDDESEFARLLAEVSPDVDAIVLSGGVSVGAFDVVKAVLAPLPSMWFGPLAMQPGKPQGFGHLADGTVVFALPGNPVSVYVSFEVFVRPGLRRLAGDADPRPVLVDGVAEVGWRSPPGREQYMPVVMDDGAGGPVRVRPSARRGSGSHLVGGLAGADGLARVAADVSEVRAGDTVAVLRGVS
ncbi:molybdopterin molybdotransferase MoeA [Occultella gossypii]|uniref:Molybdopterin molybdenumtransferase n=1 Tax=Occultella gossypii TaxID=2800820 RepID=A0ABS7SFR9_9MICO|nr:gephyrin-like molybdotransferase Glp [Occultella gossypii]MBZ2199188.1 molybdopterin molybdotransferase MoeA [Occultella gossypii]